MDTNNPIKAFDHVMLYDGVCIFCNNAVDFVLDNEKDSTLRFMPLQSEASKKILNDFGYPEDYMESILYIKDGFLYDKSTAALKIAKSLKFPFSWLRVFIILPKFLRDFMYDIVAKNRYKWFGKFDACTIPDEHIRVRFLQ